MNNVTISTKMVWALFKGVSGRSSICQPQTRLKLEGHKMRINSFLVRCGPINTGELCQHQTNG